MIARLAPGARDTQRSDELQAAVVPVVGLLGECLRQYVVD
jgi:hypothetical protein